jgi:Tfp pilus assembly protein PilX
MLIPLHQKVKDFENSNQAQIGVLDEQIKTQSEAMANQQKALQNAQSSLQSAESNLRDAEKNAAIEDGVVRHPFKKL